jgi:hypothetical protein
VTGRTLRPVTVRCLTGDKSGDWDAWHEWAVPLADDLYDTYRAELRHEGLI